MAEQRVGVVEHWYGRIRVATVRVEQPIALRDRLRVRGAHDDFVVRVKSMELEHKPVDKATPGQVVGIRMRARAHERSSVYRAEARGLLARLLGR